MERRACGVARWISSLLTAGLLVVASARAETLRVDASDVACGDATGRPFCTLAAALAAANAGPSPVTVELQPGSVHVLSAVDHVAEGANGLPAIDSDITIEARAGGERAVIRRAGDSGMPVFRLLRVTAGGRLTLRRLILSHGATAAGYDGAAIWNLGSLSLEDCHLLDNRSGDDGGAVRNDGALHAARTRFVGNQARGRGGTGGGLYNVAIGGPGIAVLEDAVFEDNEAGSSGGAIWNEGTLTLTDGTLRGNQAIWGGGGIHNVGVATLIGSAVTGNRASVTGGGLRAHGPVHLHDSRVADNDAPIGPDCEGRVIADRAEQVANPVDCTLEIAHDPQSGEQGTRRIGNS